MSHVRAKDAAVKKFVKEEKKKDKKLELFMK
jgi:hypothetical protein